MKIESGFISLMAALLLSLTSTSCGPSVQDYSKRLTGTWERYEEDPSDGTLDRATTYLTFGEIDRGDDSGQVSAFCSGRFEDPSRDGFSFDYNIEVFGIYTIDPDNEEYPLNMVWEVDGLNEPVVNVENFKWNDIVKSIQSEIDNIGAAFTGALLGMADMVSPTSEKAMAAKMRDNLAIECRKQLRARNDDPGAYGLTFGDGPEPSITISGGDFHKRFERADSSRFVTEIEEAGPED